MIGDDLGQIVWLGPLWNNGGCIRNMLEQRSVREERAARYKNNPRIRPPVADEIRGRDGATVFQHHVKNHDIW